MADPGKQVGEAFIQVGAKGVPEAKAELESLRAELKKVSDELLLLKQSADQAAGVGGTSAGAGAGGVGGGVSGGGGSGILGLITNLSGVRTAIAGVGIGAAAQAAFAFGDRIGTNTGVTPSQQALADRFSAEDVASIGRGLNIRTRGVTAGGEIAAGIQPGRVEELKSEIATLEAHWAELKKRMSAADGGLTNPAAGRFGKLSNLLSQDPAFGAAFGDPEQYKTFLTDVAMTGRSLAARREQLTGLLERISPYTQMENQRQLLEAMSALRPRRR